MRPSFSGLRGVSLPMRTKAQQGARANDHGCHVSCSEQHEPRQPRSWLILNVRQKIDGTLQSACTGATKSIVSCSKPSNCLQAGSGNPTPQVSELIVITVPIAPSSPSP